MHQKFPYRIIDIGVTGYPNLTAHANQSMQMACAFARQRQEAEFYVRHLNEPETVVRGQYPGASDSPLVIHNMRMNRVSQRLAARVIPTYILFNSQIALRLLTRRGSAQRQILFVRSWRERLFWGQIRQYFPTFRKWIFICEAHDMAGLKPEMALEENPFKSSHEPERNRRQRALQTMTNFDLFLCVTRALSDDLKRWSDGRLRPYVLPNASGLPRLPEPPAVRISRERVVLGYVGTVDQYRGVDKVLIALRVLPSNYRLRIVGRIPERSDSGQGPEWLEKLLQDPNVKSRVELVPPVPAARVAHEIDRCDIVLQPASSHIFTLRYACPLKSIDYAVRGKPIVAADVPCHRELLQDGVNARLYRHEDPMDLAACIQSLVDQPRQAQAIARAAWEQSADYNYDARARRILELADRVRERRHAKHPA